VPARLGPLGAGHPLLGDFALPRSGLRANRLFPERRLTKEPLALYRVARDGLLIQREADELTLVAEAHRIARGKQMITKLWGYVALIAGEARRARDGRRRTMLGEPVVNAYEWLTLEQCVKHERRRRNGITPGAVPTIPASSSGGVGL
jgi:hypothetical protein